MSKLVWRDLREIEGVQHCHGSDCDEYYYRPLVYGDNLFTYVAHIPPGGGFPGDQGESEMFETSLYILAGEVVVTVGHGTTPDSCDEQFVLRPHMAMHRPKGLACGMWNRGDVPVSLVLSFSPPPAGPKNPREMRELVEKRGRSVEPPAEMNAMAGSLLGD